MRIRRKRAHYGTVRWAHKVGDPRLIDISTEHPACDCYQCRNHLLPPLRVLKAANEDKNALPLAA